MADPALNPRKPDDATPTGGAAGDANAEPDLEAQVDALLAEVSDTVEQISRRLEPDQEEPEDELDPDAEVTDEGAQQRRPQ